MKDTAYKTWKYDGAYKIFDKEYSLSITVYTTAKSSDEAYRNIRKQILDLHGRLYSVPCKLLGRPKIVDNGLGDRPKKQKKKKVDKNYDEDQLTFF